jgi:hypothetical protein
MSVLRFGCRVNPQSVLCATIPMVNYSAKSGGLVKRLRHRYTSDIDACCCRRKRQRMDTLDSNQNQCFVKTMTCYEIELGKHTYSISLKEKMIL